MRTHPRPAARAALAVWLAAVLGVLWWHPYVPTGDGPSHLYNAVIIREALAGQGRQLEYFEVAFRPFPNWTGHAALAALLGVVSPPIAEKILVSGYFLGWACALDVFLGATGACLPAVAVLGGLIGIHLPLMLGFYNFTIGLMVYVLTLGLWLRGLGGSFGGAAVIGVLLLVGYFSHPVTFVLALVAIVWTWWPERDRRSGDLLRVAVASAPASMLAAWYLLFGVDPHAPPPLDAAGAAAVGWWTKRLRELDVLWYGDRSQHHLAWITTAAWIAIFGLSSTGWRASERRRGRSLIGFVIVLWMLALVLPERVGGHGGYLVMRLALVAMVTALGGFMLPPRPSLRHGATAAMALLMVASLGSFRRYEARANEDIAHYLSGLAAFPRGRVFIPLVERRSPFRVDPLAHTSSYYAIETDGIDLGNYEADLYYFPVRFRADAPRPADVPTLQRRFDTVDLDQTSRLVDALLIWGSVPQAVERSDGFRRSFVNGSLSIFLSTRRAAASAP